MLQPIECEERDHPVLSLPQGLSHCSVKAGIVPRSPLTSSWEEPCWPALPATIPVTLAKKKKPQTPDHPTDEKAPLFLLRPLSRGIPLGLWKSGWLCCNCSILWPRLRASHRLQLNFHSRFDRNLDPHLPNSVHFQSWA